MELKTNYQYTYFIHPFVIKNGKYQKYILKMLKDKKSNLKTFQKEKDFKMYQYFLPSIREFLFSSFSMGSAKMKKLEELPIETRSALLSKKPCVIFEYNLGKNIQGKVDDKKGIFFNIQKMEVICFNTGICFLAIKTNLEDETSFANLLNFNYKFRDINQEKFALETYDNIRLQTNDFTDIATFRELIKKITGSNLDANKLDIDTERFLTYSYVCIDQENWNANNEFEKIKHYYSRYGSILPADSSRETDEKITTFSKWKYAKLALTKLGVTLFSSSTDMNNYTVLPDEYENQYFYTYIWNLYQKLYLKKIKIGLKDKNKIVKARKEFVNFTKKLWIQEITEDEIGTKLNHKIREVFELERLYNEVKNQYDVLYKDLNIERDKKSTVVIIALLVAVLLFNILNFVTL